jgi:dephospho-CoA kinase
MERKIIGIIGRIAAGKDTAANFLVKKYSFKKIVMSNILRQEARKRKKHPTRIFLRRLQFELRKSNTYYLVDKVIKEIEKTKKSVVIDGLRDYQEALYAKEKLNIKIILIEASPVVRFKRLRIRNREGDPRTYHEFLHQDSIEDAVFNFPRTMKLADFRIKSDKGKEVLYKDLKQIVKEMKL